MRNPFRRQQRLDSGPVEQRDLGGTALGWQGVLTDPAAIPPYPGYGQTVAGIPVNAQTAMQVPAVFSAIRLICFAIGKLGDPYAYKVELSDDNVPYEVRLPEQPAILTDTFGGDIGGLMNYDGRNRTVGSMALFGEAWWYIVQRDRTKQPTVIEPLNPLWVEMKDENGQRNYYYGVGSQKVQLDPANLRHIPLIAQPGGDRGLSAIRYLGVIMGLALASLEFGSLFFSQGASPSYLLETDQKVSAVEAERLVERFLVQHAGLGQSHLPLLLDQGLKASKILSTPDEAQFNATLTGAYESIAGFFGVPVYLLGIMAERGNAFGVGATEEMMRRFEMTCLVGYITALEEAFSRLLPNGIRAKFDTSKLTHPDAQALAALIMTLRQTNSASINDVRTRYLGLKPVDGGDEVVAPLASNVAPSQTGDGANAPGGDKPDEAGEPKADRPDVPEAK